WDQGKNFEASTPVGPFLVTPDELGVPEDKGTVDLEITCRVDGQVMQSARTSDLLFSPAYLVSYVSRFTTLRPGDLIATGTPGGVGAGELRRRQAGPAAVIGRAHEHPVRLAAVESPAAAIGELIAAMGASLAELAAALEPLTDDDVEAKTENVKYGPEPLSAFFDRYVLAHKAGHLEQLQGLR